MGWDLLPNPLFVIALFLKKSLFSDLKNHIYSATYSPLQHESYKMIQNRFIFHKIKLLHISLFIQLFAIPQAV